jgi:hypothetical protein
MNKDKLKDDRGFPLTQSLFLELKYSEYAVYSLKDEDYIYKGKEYPSLKRLYLEMEDTTEYVFANEYLLGWNHWKRLCENKLIRKEIDQWREELELKLRAKGMKSIIESAVEGNYNACKFLTDRGWDKRAAGRPSSAEVQREKAMQSKLADEFSADIKRLR